MNAAVILLVIFSAWKWGDWKNWQNYQSTMLLSSLGNLLYNTIYHHHYLWEVKPGLFGNHIVIELIYSFVILPLTAIMLLSNLPEGIFKKFLKLVKYTVVYSLLEYFFFMYGQIEYNYGWCFICSVLWNIMMFFIWMVHHKKPLVAYLLSVIVVMAIFYKFPVKLH